MDHHTKEHLHETPWVVTGPLIALAIPSVVIGWLTIGPVLFGEYFDGAIANLEGQNPLEIVGEEFHGAGAFVLHGFSRPGGLSRGGRRARCVVPVLEASRHPGAPAHAVRRRCTTCS